LLQKERTAPQREQQPECGTSHGHDEALDEEQPRDA
jgi:hypothetical protein